MIYIDILHVLILIVIVVICFLICRKQLVILNKLSKIDKSIVESSENLKVDFDKLSDNQKKMLKNQTEIMLQIEPALRATVKNRKDLTLLATKYEECPPQKVNDMISKRIDYYGRKQLSEIKVWGEKIIEEIVDKLVNGIYVRMDRRGKNKR